MHYLTTEDDLFLIKFYGSNKAYIFCGDSVGRMGELIKMYGKDGIEFIKRWSGLKSQFKLISKAVIKSYFSNDTHSILELQKSNFIK